MYKIVLPIDTHFLYHLLSRISETKKCVSTILNIIYTNRLYWIVSYISITKKCVSYMSLIYFPTISWDSMPISQWKCVDTVPLYPLILWYNSFCFNSIWNVSTVFNRFGAIWDNILLNCIARYIYFRPIQDDIQMEEKTRLNWKTYTIYSKMKI